MADVNENKAGEEQSYPRMILVGPDGKEHEFEPLLTFELDDKDIIVLQPVGEGGEENLQLFGFHAGPNDEVILDDLDDETYYAAGERAELILNGEIETDDYVIDNGQFSEEEAAQMRQDSYEAELQAELEAEDEEYCYEDAQGRLFIYGEGGKIIYLNEYGEPIEEEGE